MLLHLAQQAQLSRERQMPSLITGPQHHNQRNLSIRFVSKESIRYLFNTQSMTCTLMWLPLSRVADVSEVIQLWQTQEKLQDVMTAFCLSSACPIREEQSKRRKAEGKHVIKIPQRIFQLFETKYIFLFHKRAMQNFPKKLT